MDADSVKRLIEDHEILRDQVIKLEMQIEELVSQAKIDQVIIAERFEMNQGLETLYNLSEALFEEIENQWGTEALDAWCRFFREFRKTRSKNDQKVSTNAAL